MQSHPCIIKITILTAISNSGVLVFFASYSLMNATINAMQKKSNALTSVWEEIGQLKQIVVEPRQKVKYVFLLTVWESTLIR